MRVESIKSPDHGICEQLEEALVRGCVPVQCKLGSGGTLGLEPFQPVRIACLI